MELHLRETGRLIPFEWSRRLLACGFDQEPSVGPASEFAMVIAEAIPRCTCGKRAEVCVPLCEPAAAADCARAAAAGKRRRAARSRVTASAKATTRWP